MHNHKTLKDLEALTECQLADSLIRGVGFKLGLFEKFGAWVINKILMSKLFSPFVTVAQNHRAIVERLGKFHSILEPGLNWKIPFFDRVAYRHSLKESVLDIEHQTAITKDNVKINISGVLYYKVTDAYKAAYEVSEPFKAMSMLAQTSMRSEIGLLELDRTF